MKANVVHVAVYVLLIGVFFSCKREKMEPNLKLPGSSAHNVINRGAGADDEPILMELGEKIENPYKKSRMIDAWNNAYPAYTVQNLPVTHRQITFTPTTWEEVVAIEELDIDIYNYPFGYEITKEGDYYVQPGKSETDIPELYAVVPEDISIPDNLPHTVQEELCLLPLNTRATREAFRLADVAYKEEITEALPDTPPIDITRIDFMEAIIGLTKDKCPMPIITTSRGDDYSDGDNGDHGLSASPCGCDIWTNNEDMPSGCVKVEDTEWGLQPLESVRVSFRNLFFSRRAYTNEHGCFKIDHDYWPAAQGYVYFENWFVDVRSFDYNIFDTHYDWLGGYDLMGSTHINNLDITYWKSTDKNNRHTSYYTAATFMNSFTTFQKYCVADGITGPPTRMRVMLMKEQYAGSMPMLHQMAGAGYYALTSGLLGPIWGAFLGTIFAPFIYPIYAGIAPDMIIGYDRSSYLFESDQLRELMYHELSHSIHFQSAGSSIWASNISFVVNNGATDPYGSIGLLDGMTLNANQNRCQLMETWAYFLGKVYTHRTYGLHNSFSTNCNYTWITQELERKVAKAYFPFALLQDLRDKPSDYCVSQTEPGVIDLINHGYTIKQMYDALGTNQSLAGWRNSLPNTGQSTTNMNSTFSSYPFIP